MERPLISVIVPVYKVEAYLIKCISSIAGQTYADLEIILVDDGSPDRSGAICDSWAAKDSRIRVIHQENAGGGAARNAALDIARGEMIAFVDSDDYISPVMLETLLAQMTPDVDLVECRYVTVSGDEAVFVPEAGKVQRYTAAEAMAEHIRDRHFRQLIWNKLYRRHLLDGVRFPAEKGIDDEFFTYQAIGRAGNLVRMDAVLYAYRQQGTSVMHTLDADQRLLMVKARQQRHDYICQFMPELKRLSACSLWFSCIYQGQLALDEPDRQVRQKCMDCVMGVIARYPIRIRGCSLKDKIWLSMAKVSFRGICAIRKLLKIGY